jgi:hypothetical protein
MVEGLPNIESLLKAGTQTLPTPSDSEHQAAIADSNSGESHNSKPPRREGERETRTYKGAIYEKGEDGQWHLQQT